MHPSDGKLRLFSNTRTALFIERLNRFVVRCSIGNTVTEAYLPNPGRLRELLLPGRAIRLIEHSTGAERKYRYTVVAVERDETPIMLHTHLANRVVHWLLEKRAIPFFETADIIKPEVTVNRSRFDFLLRKDGRPFLLEVKSCTLFEDRVAMFPDAVTLRGRRHLMELAEHAKNGTPGGVMFLIHAPKARFFLPDYHTDFDFAHTFLNVRDRITFCPISITWNNDLVLTPNVREVTIPWETIHEEAQDRGSYILICHLPHNERIEIGKLGTLPFRRGYYLYVGSAKKNLSKRMERHLRKRKTFHWHIDYLRDRADRATALAIRSSRPLECIIATALGTITDWSVPGFGSSDCSCETHLFGMHRNPQHNASFVQLLQDFRIKRLQNELELRQR